MFGNYETQEVLKDDNPIIKNKSIATLVNDEGENLVGEHEETMVFENGIELYCQIGVNLESSL